MRHENKDEMIARVRQLREEGKSWKAIARDVGITDDTAQRWGQPDYAERRKGQNARARQTLKEGRRSPAGFLIKPTMPRPAHDDAERLKREIPPDTRDLTARMFGDPIPQRSALAMRARA